jgi:SAM-dependent methyltransferase
MNLKKDAYGQQVFAYFKGKPSSEIVEREDGLIGVSTGSPLYFSDYNKWPVLEKKAIKYAKGNVLDVGCGAGRVCLYLQKKGLNVLGFDNSPLAIKVCKLRGVKNAKLLSIENIGKLKFSSIDSVIMFGNNFGLFGNFNKAKVLLKEIYKITKPNAVIIAQSVDPYKTKDSIHLSYHKLNKKRGRMSGQLKIRVRFEKYISDWFDYLLISQKEMKEILEGTGWKIKKFINSKSSSYVAIIEKV